MLLKSELVTDEIEVLEITSRLELFVSRLETDSFFNG